MRERRKMTGSIPSAPSNPRKEAEPPQAHSIDQRIRYITEEFGSIDDALYRYELLLAYSSQLPRLPEAEKTNDKKVSGCQSNAWLKLSNPDGLFHMEADCDTLIVRGILQVLSFVFEGQTCLTVSQTPMNFLERAGLLETFDSTRRSGISAIIAKIKDYCTSQQDRLDMRSSSLAPL